MKPPEDDPVARQAVILKYARLKAGKPIFCTPSQRELSSGSRASWRTAGKIIYPNPAAAANAANELEALGAKPMVVYVCPRSRSGHAHHATRRKRKAE